MVDLLALLKKMTVKQKIGQLTLLDFKNQARLEDIKEGRVGALLNIGLDQDTNELQRISMEESELKIPLLIGDDVIHGFQTIYPIPIAESCSWNLDLIERNTHFAKLEAYSHGINLIFAPMVDITHDPRWGRIMETCGEDPYLTSQMAKAKVRGIQKAVDGKIVASCPKHFTGYGAVEAGLDYNTTDYSIHRLKNLYLPPFKSALDSGALTIMSAFTTFNDQPIASSRFLFEEILRKEWGFEGVLISDWAQIEQLIPHGVAKDKYEASLKALSLGIDIDLASKVYLEFLEKVIEDNPDLEEKLDSAVLRVLKLKAKMGLFDNPYTKKVIKPLGADLRKMAKEAADEAIVLLKNDSGVLPLTNTEEKILVIGPYVDDKDVHLGAWAFKGNPKTCISVKEGLEKTFKKAVFYEVKPNDSINYDKIKELSLDVSKIIVTLGEPRDYSGENHNRQFLDLPFNQNELVDALATFNKPIIALVFSGRPLAITDLNKKAASILWCWHLGVEAGNSITSVLTGEVNPSAKLTQTFPKTLGQVPIYYNRYQTGRPELLSYVDGNLEPLYPFGFGLHYGNIKYSQMEVKYSADILQLVVKVLLENESNYPIYEIVQVYLSSKYNQKLRPVKELCGFKKEMIEPGCQKTVEISLALEEHFEDTELMNELTLEIMAGPNSQEGLKQTVQVKGGQVWLISKS
ncbi:MAG TPA: glycosyl hydrolase [Acholeplasmataceae bacterium]|jgi:beta-glucosidase|nr:glycosyl hydrolase [Acholeplasmataceae bacterium]